MLSAESIRELREDYDNNVQVIVCTFDTCLLFSVSCISLAQLLTICISYAFYICYTIQSSSGGKHARNCVHLGKIENSS